MTRIGESLVRRGILSADQLQAALQAQLLRGGHLGTSLLELGYLDESRLARELSELLGMRPAPKEMFADIPRRVLDALPRAEAVRRRVVPIGLDGNCLHLAVIDRTGISNLSTSTGYKIELYVAPEARILEALERYYGVPRRLRYVSVAKSSRPEPDEIAATAAPPPTTDRTAASAGAEQALRALSAQLSEVTTHAELGEVLLDQALESCERCLLFSVENDTAGVANARNIDVDPETWDGLRLRVDQRSIFALVNEDGYFRGPLPSAFDHPSFFGRLSLESPAEVLLLPIYGERSLEAVVYGDSGPEGTIVARDEVYPAVLHLASLATRMLGLRVQLGSV